MKVQDRIIDQRLREQIEIDKKQYGFMKDKGTDAIFVMRQLQEKTLEGNQKPYCAFIDLEKTYYQLPREVVYWCLRNKGVLERLVMIVKDMYEGANTEVRTSYGNAGKFVVKVVLHQGSALRPFLFVIVKDVLSQKIRDRDLWELLFADDLAITAYTEEDLQVSKCVAGMSGKPRIEDKCK